MNYETALRMAIESFDNNVKLLFQRVNYFLVATAFLVTGFATSLGISLQYDLSSIAAIAYAMLAAGICLSAFFMIINYLNTYMLLLLTRYIRYLERHPSEERVPDRILPSQITQLVVNKIHRRGLWRLIGQCSYELLVLVRVMVFHRRSGNNMEAANRSLASHTYLIPMGFLVLWVVFLILARVLVC